MTVQTLIDELSRHSMDTKVKIVVSVWDEEVDNYREEYRNAEYVVFNHLEEALVITGSE